MGRARRVDVGGMIYHALNRANFRSRGEMVPDTFSPLAIANKLFGEEERADIVAMLAADPESGDLIRGTSTRTGAGVVSRKWLDNRAGRSAGILPANAAKMAALRCPVNYRTLH